MSRQNNQWTVKPPMAARLVVALSIVGLFVFVLFLGGRFTRWQRCLIAYVIEIPAVIAVIIVERRRRRKPAKVQRYDKDHPFKLGHSAPDPLLRREPETRPKRREKRLAFQPSMSQGTSVSGSARIFPCPKSSW